MADQAFEHRLHLQFAEAPAFPDADQFALRIEHRLDRGWAVRRMAIGAAGLIGGGLAVVQLMGSDWLGRVELASRTSAVHAGRGLGGLADGLSALTPVLRAVPLGGEALWLIAGLGALAVALLATRMLEQL